ncbi:hypothetical protein [Cryptosporangium phraense]|uniref:Glycosyltransferase family 39 protein n=1 Tax=Cryptosporangium phraense TaxID=2593070 RepID=A0A545AP67_9ACTN|nr:hypothetical protein [Cryptosporangium phraense]TQS43083.1 hypothetical protein FL583_21870 [Cryptosporangium phraense]
MPPTTVSAEPRARPRATRALLATAAAVAACAAWGAWLSYGGTRLHLDGGLILTGSWHPRFPAFALVAIGLAVVFVRYAAEFTRRAAWGRLLVGSAAATALWAVVVAATDGIGALSAPLTTRWEYLRDVHRVGELRPFLSTFTEHVLGGSAGFQWVTHVSGHPPGALLVFTGLDRVGLGAPGWSAALCILAGASAVPAVLLTLRLLADETTARAAAPFVALAPSVLWIATSADALFLGVSAWGVCALAHAASRHDRAGDLLAVGAGLLLGATLFLSYGLTLMSVPAVAVVLGQRRVRPLLVAAPAVLAVIGAFAAEGFWWLDGLAIASERVREGPAWIDRPTAYFLVANLAALAIAVGPAAVAGLASAGAGVRASAGAAGLASAGAGARERLHGPLGRAVVLPAAALVAVLLACASNLSKGEVERIYLPFELWLLTATAALPPDRRRRWLAAQLALTLLVQLTLELKW